MNTMVYTNPHETTTVWSGFTVIKCFSKILALALGKWPIKMLYSINTIQLSWMNTSDIPPIIRLCRHISLEYVLCTRIPKSTNLQIRTSYLSNTASWLAIFRVYPSSKHCVCLEINTYIQIIKERTQTK
jgi:hypothetical protein